MSRIERRRPSIPSYMPKYLHDPSHYIERIKCEEDEFQQIVVAIRTMYHIGFIVDIPESRIPHIHHPLSYMNAFFAALVAYVVQVCWDKIRDCPLFACQAPCIQDQADDMWYCTNPKCTRYSQPFEHGRMVRFDIQHQVTEQIILTDRNEDGGKTAILDDEKVNGIMDVNMDLHVMEPYQIQMTREFTWKLCTEYQRAEVRRQTQLRT